MRNHFPLKFLSLEHCPTSIQTAYSSLNYINNMCGWLMVQNVPLCALFLLQIKYTDIWISQEWFRLKNCTSEKKFTTHKDFKEWWFYRMNVCVCIWICYCWARLQHIRHTHTHIFSVSVFMANNIKTIAIGQTRIFTLFKWFFSVFLKRSWPLNTENLLRISKFIHFFGWEISNIHCFWFCNFN